MSDDMGRYISGVPTSVDDLVTASEAVRTDAIEHTEDERDSMFVIAMTFRGKRTPQQVMAIFCRMQALVSIVNSGAVNKWMLEAKSDDGALYVQGAVYEAAAKCPLRFSDADAFFDRKEFLDLVLRHSDDEGRA